MESSVIFPFLLALAAGGATAIGAALTFFIRKNDFKILALGMSFSAGVMIYLSFSDIMPLAKEYIAPNGSKGGLLLAYSMFFLGAGIAAVIDYFVPEHLESENLECPKCPKQSFNKTKRAAILSAIALAAHNFPEGLSVFVTTLEDATVGIAIAFAILLHNIPEGISVALPIYNSTGSKKKAFWVATFSGMTEPLGALAAYFIFAPLLTPAVIGSALALTAGMMVFISLDELLPMAKEYGEEHYGIFGAFAGMAFIALSSLIF